MGCGLLQCVLQCNYYINREGRDTVGGEAQDAGTFAYTLIEHLADEHGEGAQAYLIEVVDEVMLLEPGVREHFADLLLGELCEEVARREDARHSHATVELISAIQADWRQQS